MSEGHGPGVGVTEELKLPASPHANANAEAKARYEQKRRRYELLTTMLRLPYRRGGMAVSTPDLDTAAHFLAGRTEMMEHLRKYSVPWKPAIERWHSDAASSERRAEYMPSLGSSKRASTTTPLSRRWTSYSRRKTIASRAVLMFSLTHLSFLVSAA